MIDASHLLVLSQADFVHGRVRNALASRDGFRAVGPLAFLRGLLARAA